MTDAHPDLTERLTQALGPQYRLERELGRGGMGIVYLAVDTALDRPVAVKVVHPELAGHEGIVRRFLDEARTIARLRHPNIVTVHAAGSGGDLLWYVMDQVPGETLRARLDRDRKLAPDEVTRITADLASALDAAGHAGVVHRDVKPENILIESGTGRALLADFGIARAMQAEQAGPLTAVGVAVGTPAYMSPEQAAGDAVDTRSDLYALGVVAYEMLTGQTPFTGPHRVVVSQHLTQRPTPVRRLRPEIPAPLADAIMVALEKNPSERWQTGADFRRALLGDAPRRPARKRRRALRLAGVAVVVVVGLALGALALFRRANGPPPGVNPRLSMLVLPFNNLRNTTALDWLREGSVSMLSLNLSQWNDLQVVDNERLHDLLDRHNIGQGEDIGLEMARRLAREAGVWTVVLGEYDQAGDSLHLTARVYDVATGRKVETAQVDAAPGQDVRPVFDDLAARLLDLSGAPSENRTALAEATTSSLEAFRAYLQGVAALNNWDLASAERSLEQATLMDTTFGLAYYKLALTRGWLVGQNDSISTVAMARATEHSAGLPQRQRSLIAAYRAFIDSDYQTARGLYQQLIARDTTDADAWYGLGEAWFHDLNASVGRPMAMTESLRAFQRTLALDPDYLLAYEHIEQMLTQAANPAGALALLPRDSFALRRSLPDSTARGTAETRAKDAVVALARNWVASQPTTFRAHGALVDALIASQNYPAALGELARYKAVSPAHPEMAFLEARVRFASGQVDSASAILQQALDSTAPEDFRGFESTPTVLGDIAAAANVFAYRGDVNNATRAIDFVDRVRSTVFPGLSVMESGSVDWRQLALAQLHGAIGAPAPALRNMWHTSVEAARSATPDRRRALLEAGAPAAMGLFTGLASDTAALIELYALSGEEPAREVRAAMAIARDDTATARRIMQEPDSASGPKMWDYLYRRPVAAQVYAELGEYQTALKQLEGFEPAALQNRGFDARWGMLGRVRLLRASLEAHLGHTDRARQEYERVLAQWKGADPSVRRYIRMAEQGLAALEGEAS